MSRRRFKDTWMRAVYELFLADRAPAGSGSRLADAFRKGGRCRKIARKDLHPPKGSLAYAAWCAGWDKET